MRGELFLGGEVSGGLRVRIAPRGWRGLRPEISVLDGNNPVLTAYVDGSGLLCGWLSHWGIHGNTHAGYLTAADICELMGWTLPEGVQ